MNVWPVAVNICICSRMLTDISSCFLRQSSMCLAMGRCATSVPGCALSDSDSSGGVVFGRRTVVIKVYCHGDAWHVSPYWLPFEPSKMECGTCLQSVPGVVQADQPYEQNNSHPFFLLLLLRSLPINVVTSAVNLLLYVPNHQNGTCQTHGSRTRLRCPPGCLVKQRVSGCTSAHPSISRCDGEM